MKTPFPCLPWALALTCERLGAEDLALRLRTGPTRVLGRIDQDRVLLEMRTVGDAEIPALAGAIGAAAGEIGGLPQLHSKAPPSLA